MRIKKFEFALFAARSSEEPDLSIECLQDQVAPTRPDGEGHLLSGPEPPGPHGKFRLEVAFVGQDGHVQIHRVLELQGQIPAMTLEGKAPALKELTHEVDLT